MKTKVRSTTIKHTPVNEKKAIRIFKARIEKGIKYLDKRMKREDWLKRLNPITLNLEQDDVCVCGQVFGSYFSAFGYDKESGAQYGFFVEPGFLGSTDGHENWFWDLLGYMWAKKLVELKHKNGFKN